jgi:hypothetical protein
VHVIGPGEEAVREKEPIRVLPNLEAGQEEETELVFEPPETTREAS